jgi:hypothetical protein
VSYNQTLLEQLAKLGQGFFAFNQSFGSASTYPVNQLWNPSTSGVRVCIDAILPYASGSGGFAAGFLVTSTQITTNPVSGTNKLAGSAVSKGIVYSQAVSTMPPIAASAIFYINGPISEPNILANTAPIILPPGFGANFVTFNTSVANLGCTFNWTEQ